MAIDIEGLDVLKRMCEEPGRFPKVIEDTTKLAKAVAAKAVKARNLDAGGLRDIRRILGEDAFVTLLDGWNPKAILALVDKNNKAIKTAPADEQRARVKAIAGGEEPMDPPQKAVKAASGPRKTGQRALTSKAVKAKRDLAKNPDA